MVDINVDTLIADFKNYVVSPLNAFGIGGFLFDVEGDTSASLNAEITDHYTEANEAIQDHIAIKPKKITLKGYVGELIYQEAQDNETFLQSAVQKLTIISSYLPVLSKAATQITDLAQAPTASDITLGDAANLYGAVNNIINSAGIFAKQARSYAYFETLMDGKILMGVQTPWKLYTNMAIESVTPIQDERSQSVTDFSITLKEIRTAHTKTTAFGTSTAPAAANPNGNPDVQYQGVAAMQASLPVSIGNIPGITLPTSTVSGILSQVTGVASIPRFFIGPNGITGQ